MSIKAPWYLAKLFISRLKGSLWFIPSVFTAGAVALSFVTILIDQRISGTLGGSGGLLFSAGAEGARGVLSTIAGSIITVTGVVFSITIVALQLASTQYTPRVLRSFTEDRATQVVLGIFIGTFTYALLVLRTVRSEFDDYERFVPAASVTLAVFFALASIAALIFFVNHVARSIRVENVLERIANDLMERVGKLFPHEIGHSPHEQGNGDGRHSADPAGEESLPLRASSSGYLQHVEEDGLLATGDDHDIQVRMLVRVGDFVIVGDPIASVSPAEAAVDAQEHLNSLFRIGSERTLYQDLMRGLIELTDVALRALSPGINDPTTAMAAIDRLTQVLALVGQRDFPDPVRIGDQGRVRFVALRPSFDDLIHPPFAQLRHSGASTPTVAIHLITSLRRIGSGAPADRRASALREIEEVLTTARRTIVDRTDQARVEAAARAAIAELALEG